MSKAIAASSAETLSDEVRRDLIEVGFRQFPDDGARRNHDDRQRAHYRQGRAFVGSGRSLGDDCARGPGAHSPQTDLQFENRWERVYRRALARAKLRRGHDRIFALRRFAYRRRVRSVGRWFRSDPRGFVRSHACAQHRCQKLCNPNRSWPAALRSGYSARRRLCRKGRHVSLFCFRCCSLPCAFSFMARLLGFEKYF